MKVRVQRTAGSRSGFTLVEIMIVVAIIGVLASIAIPGFIKQRNSAKRTAFISDLRVFLDASDVCNLETGDYPEDGETGQIPLSLVGYVRDRNFTNGTPIGGFWDTERDWGVIYAVGVIAPNISAQQLIEIDKELDDGLLNAGKFRMLMPNRYYYVVAE